MSTHGGARDGAGRKPKYYNPYTGEPLKSDSRVIPDIITKGDIEEVLKKKLKPKDKQTT